MRCRILIKALIIDDEKPAIINLERFLDMYSEIEVVGAYTEIDDAFKKAKEENINLIFLDIEMPKINGIEAAKKILEIDNNIQIVFITAYNHYAVDAFEVEAIDYVMKPIMKRRLDKTIERIINRHKQIYGELLKLPQHQIVCFGNFEILRGNQSIKWRTFKAKELAAYLIHNRGKFVNKYKIIEDLWPDKDDEQAIKLLHTNIYYVRNGLKSLNLEQAIIYSNEMYKFDIEGIFCDVDEFESVLKNNLSASGNIDNYVKSIELYNAEYLEGNDYSWAFIERERLSKMYMSILMELSDFYISQGKFSNALFYLKTILEKAPYHEDTHRKLLSVYFNIKDYVNLKEHYKSLSNYFRCELGVELSEHTIKLYNKYIGKLKF